eukprot:6897-Heterococcus_DN1.PRE.1
MEAMKDEAISKLKELGNSLLGHFGMSLDNFKVNQDEKGGGGNSISLNNSKLLEDCIAAAAAASIGIQQLSQQCNAVNNLYQRSDCMISNDVSRWLHSASTCITTVHICYVKARWHYCLEMSGNTLHMNR